MPSRIQGGLVTFCALMRFPLLAILSGGSRPARPRTSVCSLRRLPRGLSPPSWRLSLPIRSATPWVRLLMASTRRKWKRPAFPEWEPAFACAWWRRGESNPRPKILYSGLLRAFPVIWVSSPGTPAGRVPFGPSRERFRRSAPREEASGYPVRVTPLRLYGHSAVGGRRLKPPGLTDSRWRLLSSRFYEVQGLGTQPWSIDIPVETVSPPLTYHFSRLAGPGEQPLGPATCRGKEEGGTTVPLPPIDPRSPEKVPGPLIP